MYVTWHISLQGNVTAEANNALTLKWFNFRRLGHRPIAYLENQPFNLFPTLIWFPANVCIWHITREIASYCQDVLCQTQEHCSFTDNSCSRTKFSRCLLLLGTKSIIIFFRKNSKLSSTTSTFVYASHCNATFCLTNLNVLRYNASSVILTQNIKNKYIS